MNIEILKLFSKRLMIRNVDPNAVQIKMKVSEMGYLQYSLTSRLAHTHSHTQILTDTLTTSHTCTHTD